LIHLKELAVNSPGYLNYQITRGASIIACCFYIFGGLMLIEYVEAAIDLITIFWQLPK